MTAGNLATTLNVSERTIYRDIQTLSVAGIPIYTIEGRGGGVGLDEDYRVSLASLSQQDVRALFISGASSPLNDLGLSSTNEAILLKLLDMLPTLHQVEANRVRQRIYIDPTDWFAMGQYIPFIQQVQSAVLADKIIDITYQRGDGQTVNRTIDAYGMVAKSNVWYLIGKHGEQFRSYRVSRIQKLVISETQFKRDTQFDLEQFWQSHTQSFINSIPNYPVVLYILKDQQQWVCSFLSLEPTQLSPTDHPNWLQATVQFDTQQQAIVSLIGIAQQIRIIEPVGLYDALVTFSKVIFNYLHN